jgi:predicted permease
MPNLMPGIMKTNFFKIAIRNISKNKFFTVLNVTGLAIGLAASLLILLWVQDEFSFEKFHRAAGEIYRVEEDQFYSGETYHVTVTPFPSGPVWKQKIPEITEQVRIHPWLPRTLFRNGDKVFYESSLIAADSTFFNIFSYPMISGDPVAALKDPHSIVINEKTAARYFGTTNAVGQSLTLENKFRFTVSGVLRNLPGNTMFGFDVIIPFSFLREIGMMDTHWGNNSIYTFVRVPHTADIKAVNEKMTKIVWENDPEIKTKYMLFPLLDIHLHQQFGFRESKGAIMVVYIFTLIAVFILVIASINFINLSTARAGSRTKEIGIKKVAGADRKGMVLQFIMESLLLVAAALVVALVLTGLFLGLFNTISGKHFSLNDLFQTRFILSFTGVAVLTGLISGLYPALYLSSFKPVAVLKGEAVTGKGNTRLRQVLVVLQFTLSIIIAIAAVFSWQQLRYMLEKDLGFNKNNLVGIQMADNMKKQYYSLKKELENETMIHGITASTWNPVMIGSNSGGASWEGKDPDRNVLIGTNGVDYDYIKTMQIEIISGRDFSHEYSTDLAKDTTGNFLVNEEVVKLMNIGDPVGKAFRFMGINGRIIGVMKNFHFKGADQPIEPLAFVLADTSYLNMILVRLNPSDVKGSLKVLEEKWKKVLPEYPLQYSFIDKDYENQFRNLMRMTGLLKYFTILAVIIACLGLLGLSAYSAERRTHEVGIRKVMGANSIEVIFTLAREFLVFVLIAILISVPAGWYIVSRLLQQFAYHIEIRPVIFLLISVSALIVAALTVSYQAFRASGINPAVTLKTE